VAHGLPMCTPTQQAGWACLGGSGGEGSGIQP
jgi:hypothetical protein